MEENASKLHVWSPLYYGTLPHVIGGCSGGGLFRWLKLFPNGKRIAVDPISPFYDWNKPRGVALLLHSTIRMHCLLQKLQEELTEFPPVKLYRPIPRSGGGEVIVYPECVYKAVMPPLPIDRCRMLESLYDSIKSSRYLIQLISIRVVKKKTIIQLQPVGDPNARPRVLKDLEAAVHDILHGLVDLHNKGYTHRDLRWENFIKVNVQGEWKWVIIDLEAAGLDKEEWLGNGLRSWDAGMLKDRDGKKIYTKGSDMYQLGKLIVECWTLMRAWGENMQQEPGAAAKMLEDNCMEGCERCGKFDTKSKRGF
ncbi:hypothetical protein KC19_2G166600 [Ceratodon purpureus]|uniref:Protein kinase domain-containing protein n=1 Tax=Ceratodon purpureus TaxID=3225 RepID=A0A8T0IXP4_CERPU|nr:hypothetical protein KC19_2G166600 [Ceratodon purpureus]